MTASPSKHAERRQWLYSYLALRRALRPHGQINAYGEGDYWIVDDFAVGQHKIYIWSLAMLRKPFVFAVRTALKRFPDFEVLIQVEIESLGEAGAIGPGFVITSERVKELIDRKRLPDDLKSHSFF